MTTKRIHNGLNKKEMKVVSQFVKVGRPHPMTLEELSEVFAYVGKTRSNSWIRNSIRRPIALGILEPTGPKGTGTYQITALGREMVKKGLLELKPSLAKPAPKAKAKRHAKKAQPAATPEPKVEAPVAAPTPAPVAEVPVVAAPAPEAQPASTPAPVQFVPTVAELVATVSAEVAEHEKTEAAAAPWQAAPTAQ